VSPKFRALIFAPLLAALLLLPAGLKNQDISPSSEMLLTLTDPPVPQLVALPFPAAAAVILPFEAALGPAYWEPAPAALLLEIAEPQAAEAEENAGSGVIPGASLEPTAVEQSLPEDIPDEVKQIQKNLFNELWAVVYENYLYPDFNGVDWQAVRREQHERIQTGMSMPVFYQAMNQIITGLGDDHSRFLDPERTAAEDARYAGKQEFAGVGVFLFPNPEQDWAALLAVSPGGPAERAGLRARDKILSVDGHSMLDENGRLKSLLRGPEGTQVSLLVQSPGQGPRTLSLTRQRVSGPLPLPYTVITTPENKRIGYILLISFGDSTIPGQVEKALLAMNADAPLDALVLDNRFNQGGADTVLRGVLSYFTAGRLGTFTGRRVEKPLEVEPINLHGSQHIPLAVLVGRATFSYGEVFSGVLQDQGRAYVIGEQTLGNVETLKGYNFKDGSRVWIAHTSFRPQNNPNLDWEGSGILPDILAVSTWEEYTLEDDPTFLAAADILLNQPPMAPQSMSRQDQP
jgi:carboxyl-terminal processing protease